MANGSAQVFEQPRPVGGEDVDGSDEAEKAKENGQESRHRACRETGHAEQSASSRNSAFAPRRQSTAALLQQRHVMRSEASEQA